jgi:hypothetical protein
LCNLKENIPVAMAARTIAKNKKSAEAAACSGPEESSV